MSDMRDLLESMNKFAGERVGQKPGDQVRGGEPMPRKGGHKKHPYAGRLVGAAESSESILKELDQVLNENPVHRTLSNQWQEYKQDYEMISEYGAPGSAIGNDTATNPAEVFARGQEKKAAKQEIQGQLSGLVAQMQGARAQLADINKGFPQGANPVEKTMSLQQMQAQKIGLKQQIADLSSQIAALRQQAI